MEECRHGACRLHMVYLSNPTFGDGSTVQTEEVPVCFCHVQYAEDLAQRRRTLTEGSLDFQEPAPADADGVIEILQGPISDRKIYGLAKTIAFAAGIETVDNLGVCAESSSNAVQVDNHFY